MLSIPAWSHVSVRVRVRVRVRVIRVRVTTCDHAVDPGVVARPITHRAPPPPDPDVEVDVVVARVDGVAGPTLREVSGEEVAPLR